jgi:hypothetical protein
LVPQDNEYRVTVDFLGQVETELAEGKSWVATRRMATNLQIVEEAARLLVHAIMSLLDNV